MYKLAQRLGTPLTAYSLPILAFIGILGDVFCWHFHMKVGGEIWLWIAIICGTVDAIFIANVLQQYAPERNEDVIS